MFADSSRTSLFCPTTHLKLSSWFLSTCQLLNHPFLSGCDNCSLRQLSSISNEAAEIFSILSLWQCHPSWQSTGFHFSTESSKPLLFNLKHIMDYLQPTQHLFHLQHLELSSDIVLLSITLLYSLTFDTFFCPSHWEYQNTIPQFFFPG